MKIYNVSQPFLPNFTDYTDILSNIWESKQLTNNGFYCREFERKFKNFSKVENFLFTSNGTVSLQLAIEALSLNDEIITTPFSYIATLNSILWQKCKPVFVDIDYFTFNIDPNLIEKSITHKTSAIMATHVFGNPCDVENINKIAKKFNLKVIYDAAHCFGVELNNRSILNYGDISSISFHATKIFHTIEGGGLITSDLSLFEKLSQLRSFGHTSAYTFDFPGINGKNSEFHAAMGILNLINATQLLDQRKFLFNLYLNALKNLPLRFQSISDTVKYNFSYFPILLNDPIEVEKLLAFLSNYNIFPRRYFFPSLNTLPFVKRNSCPISESVASKIICLPLYHDLNKDDIEFISNALISFYHC